MLAELPEQIDPWRLARLHQIVRGTLPLAAMSRLCDSVVAVQGQAQVHWVFGIDREQRFFIHGEIEAEVMMQCQRCLHTMALPLKAHTRLGILKPGQPDDDLPPEWEPLFVEQVPLLLRDLIEDELLLALPLAPHHAVCPHNVYTNEESAAIPNPFAVLAQLKKNQ
jgi:uncharacterized protein